VLYELELDTKSLDGGDCIEYTIWYKADRSQQYTRNTTFHRAKQYLLVNSLFRNFETSAQQGNTRSLDLSVREQN
jgi:hypothetical protein